MKKARLQVRVGAAIRRRREAAEYSQEGFAALIGMHRTYYSSIELGKKNLRMATLERICQALGVQPWEVLKDAEYETAAPVTRKRNVGRRSVPQGMV
jgi:transcriptional regulator with XRE-family HTH domain